jgi:hypothetical protein
MRLLFLFTTLLLSAALLPAAYAVEGAPPLIDYQGSVLDDQGNPLAPTAPALYKMEFRIWNQIGGGDLIWSEQQTVTVFKGQFSVRLGEGTAATDIIRPQVPQNQLPLAFEGSSRFLGVTVATNPQAKTEITPRVAFLTTPYAHVANTASRVTQQAGTSSTVMLGGIGYATANYESTTAIINLTINKRTNLISAGSAGTTANLPVNGDSHELLISKIDDTLQFITIAPPAGGQINGSTASIHLKVKGESVTLQNAGGNNWWVVDDTRDNTPVGTIVSYGGDKPPAGYLSCNGASLLRADYTDLFTAIGTNWGTSQVDNLAAVDSSRFNLPNLAGRFLRGIDPNNNGVDPNATTRSALAAGGSSGRNVGSYQADVLKEHLHPIIDKKHGHASGPASATLTMGSRGWQFGSEDVTVLAATGDQDGPNVTPSYSMSVQSATSNISILATGGTENRPDNAGVCYCIKY